MGKIKGITCYHTFKTGWLYLIDGVISLGQGIVMIISLGIYFPDWCLKWQLKRLNMD